MVGMSNENNEMKCLDFKKGNERFCFRYEPGQEREVIKALSEAVSRPDLNFTWLDAAILSHQMGQDSKREKKVNQKRKL